ncbi:MAG: hypothetical protein AAF456_13145 [Planctomycetota bacterium]
MYPQTGCLGPGHQLFALGMLAKVRRDLQSKQRPEFPALLEKALEEVAASNRNVEKMIISSERFANATDDEVESLGRMLDGFDVSIVLFLRRQDSLAESMFAQAMRVRWTKFSKEKLLNPLNPRFKFYTLIQRWEQVFGNGSVGVCRFGKTPEGGGDLIDQFLDAVGARAARTDKRDFRSNTKLSRDALEFLFHHTDLSFGTIEYNRLDARLVEFSQVNPTPPQFKNFFSPDERRHILDNHADENENVARRLFDAESLFDGSLPGENEDWQPYPGLSPVAKAAIEGFLYRAKAA